ncbi:MAG TPA: TRASH domain-containing protein [Gemmataceae bacterium]|nr:TRASH domain-containing protein [Gemmataceae bacterium]
MNLRIIIACFTFAALGFTATQPANPQKEALQELQDYIGGWKGNGTSERDKTAIWKEAMSWGWRFKGNDSWLVLEVTDSKFYKSGELRYLVDKKVYELTLVDKAGKTLVFQGSLNKNNLTLERVDPVTKETQMLKFNTAGGGDRLVATYSVMPENRKVYTKEWQIGMTREGVQLAAGKKGPECIVTGGLGTTAVTYKNATYYVCCSGCRDAFKEDPEKYIKEWNDKKKAGK